MIQMTAMIPPRFDDSRYLIRELNTEPAKH